MTRIITIRREFGSGGRELGRRLSEALGRAYYDQEIISEIAQRTSLSETYVRQIIERRPAMSYPIRIGRSLHMAVMNPLLAQSNEIFKEQCAIIREMANASDCVIVGRCADYILRERKPFRLFVYADMDYKLARCREKAEVQEHMTDEELKRHILDVDMHRAAYYNHYTNQKWGERSTCDLCVNSGTIPPKVAAPALARLISEL